MLDAIPAAALEIKALLKLMADKGGSDLFLSAGALPHIKLDGLTQPLAAHKLQPGEVKRMAWELMSDEQIAEFERELEMNLALGLEGIGRFRLNVYLQRGEVSMVVRHVKSEIPPLATLNLPPVLEKLALRDRGLILVVGAAGSGKSTTLASMIDHRNSRISGHIVCIEDPIEFIHRHKRSVVDQREVGLDTHSFEAALRNVLREAPDVIMLGEIRDQQTMEHALHYAETGHLCVGTLHATSSVQAIERIVHFFPEPARKQILNDLALNLVAIVAQRLVPGVTQRRVLAAELMLNTPHLRDLIQRDQLHELKDAMSRAIEAGVQTFDEHLYRHYIDGRISLEQTLKQADSRTDLSLKINLEQGFQVDDSGVSFIDG
jgi:twitching motility protein PilU